MRKHRIGLVGYLGYATDDPIIGGQMSKTRGVYKGLCDRYGKDCLLVSDTSNWKKEKFKLIRECFRIARECDTVIIMPNKNGIKIILPLFAALKNVFGYRLAYPVVGGWLTGLLKKHGYLASGMKKVDYVLPETKLLARELQGFYPNRIDVMPAFSTREPIGRERLPRGFREPYVFSTFSRVTPEKGIDDAIETIRRVNQEFGRTVCRLDVWGPVEQGMEEHYEGLFEENREWVRSCGVLSGDDGLEKLAGYFAMLFPTYYPGEGFPVSVCESFMAGLPVIGSDWRFNGDLIEDGVTGFLFPARDVEACCEKIRFCVEHPELVERMHVSALDRSERYRPERVMRELVTWIDEQGDA